MIITDRHAVMLSQLVKRVFLTLPIALSLAVGCYFGMPHILLRLQPVQYEASVDLLAYRMSDAATSDPLLTQQADVHIMATYQDLLVQPEALRVVSKRLNLPPKVHQRMAVGLRTSHQPNSQVLTVTYRDTDKRRGTQVVKELSQLFLKRVNGLMGPDRVKVITKSVEARRQVVRPIGRWQLFGAAGCLTLVVLGSCVPIFFRLMQTTAGDTPN